MRKLTRFRRGIWLSVSSRAMSVRTHFCVVQCYSQLGWLVIKGGKPIWNPDPHQGFVDAFFFSAIWHVLGGKRGLERPGLGVAATALAGGELTVGDEVWARHGENGVTSDAYFEARVACRDTVCQPVLLWLPQALPQSVAEAHAFVHNNVAHNAGWLESDAVVLFGWNLGIPSLGRGICLSTPRMHNRRRWQLSCPLTSDSTAGKTVMAFYKRLCCSVSMNGGGL